MWVLTEIADAWDRLREEDGRFLDDQFTSWTKYALDHEDDPAWYSPIRNAAIYTGVGLGYATWTLSTGVATGFIDTLRLGDGVREGGWGYGKDALRLLVFAGPMLRVGRLGLARLASIDTFPATGTCAWVAAAKALRMTGTRHFATIEELARAVGINAPSFPAVRALSTVSQYIRQLGGATKALPAATGTAGNVEKLLANVVAANPEGVVLFSVRWQHAGKSLAHAMIAARILGRTVILDRTGRVVTLLKNLPYPEIATATLDELLLVKNATAATVVARLSEGAVLVNSLLQGRSEGLDDASRPDAGADKKEASTQLPPSDATPLLANIGLEVRSVPLRVERGLRPASAPRRPPVLSGGRTTTTTTCTDGTKIDLVDGGRVMIPRRWCESVTVDYKIYVVRPGDYLARIAKAVYGNERRWRIIYEANRSKLGPDPHNRGALRAGMELEIPVSSSSQVWDEPLPTRF
ncbi:MAG: LysM peptidoglycan-binding domain-containing protein [Polyangiaceae bacterium]|nr:LysM peptidoglycan-binding domain-containing protein [Polyangiaceae bacterium]